LSWCLFPSVCVAEDKAEEGTSVALIQEGRAESVIVVPKEASQEVMNAAALLQKYVAKSTGAELPVTTEWTGEEKAIHLGVTDRVATLALKMDGLEKDGFVLTSPDAKSVVILGKSDLGTEFGVYQFLDRYLGVRWLWPGATGEVVPKRESLVVPSEEIRQSPVFLTRRLSPLDWSGAPSESNRAWARQNRLSGEVQFMHNLYRLYDPKIFAKKNPEFYPMVQGVRVIPDLNKDSRGYAWQPNFTAPGIVDAGVKRINAYFDANPAAESYSLGINDSHSFDESAASLARRSGEVNVLGLPSVSDDYFIWANEVAQKVGERHPDKWFGTLAYTTVFDPPKKTGVHEKIIPYMTYDRMQWAKPELKTGDQERTKAWAAMASTLGWYDYTYGSFFRLPRVYFGLMQEYLSWASEHKVRHYYSEIYPNWTGEGPKTWILAKLLWNPKQDVGALLEDWCRSAVGEEAAPFLVKYYERWEKFWIDDSAKSPWMENDRTYCNFATPDYLALVKAETLEEFEGLIASAEQSSMTSDERVRMERLRRMWDYYKLGVITYQAEQLGLNHSPETEAEAMAYLDRAVAVLPLSLKRKKLMDSFTMEDWNPHRFFFNTRWSHPNDVNWGSSLLWAVKPWLTRSEKVRARVDELAASSIEAVNDHACIFLAANENLGQPFITNPAFSDNLKNWRTTKRVENLGEIKAIEVPAGTGPGGVLISGPVNVGLIQSVPWRKGLYYATARFTVPKDAKAPASAQLVFVPAKPLNGLDDLKYVLPVIEISWAGDKPQSGETREVTVPIIVPENGEGFKDMSVALRAVLQKPEEKLLLENVQLYRLPSTDGSNPQTTKLTTPAN